MKDFLKKYRGELWCAPLGFLLVACGIALSSETGEFFGIIGVTTLLWGVLPGIALSAVWESVSFPRTSILIFSSLFCITIGLLYSVWVFVLDEEAGLLVYGLALSVGMLVSVIGQVDRYVRYRHSGNASLPGVASGI